MVCLVCSKPLAPRNKCGACYAHKHLSPKIKEYQASRRAQTVEERASYSLKYRAANRSDLLAKKRVWSRDSREKDPQSHRIKSARRNAAVARATPKWLTAEHRKEIKELRLLARELQWLSEEKLTVDHIVPISGRSVSGLHVPWNLQILPHSLNCSKSTRLEG